MDRGCENVPYVGDMRDEIQNGMFYVARDIADNARTILERAAYRPDELSAINLQRVIDLLSVTALPSTHPRFRRMLNGLIGAFL